MRTRVKVVDVGRRHLTLRWVDPITRAVHQKTAGSSRRNEARKAAGKLEAELNEGRYVPPTRATWSEFRDRYESERVPSLADGTADRIGAVLNHVERLIRPRRPGDVSAGALSFFQAKLRKEGLKDATIAGHLAYLRAALRWAKRVGLLATVPEFEMPPRGKGKRMKGRPVTVEEFTRLLAIVAEVRPDDSSRWEFFLKGLWLSGLRLAEAVELSWQSDARLAVDVLGKHPRLRIVAEAEKGNKDRLLPLTPDFAELLQTVPQSEREGFVFKLTGLASGWQMTAKRAGRIISKIGERADVVVSREGGKCASAHDLRRAFGTRWAKRVKPAVLMALMRHESIETTLDYYVELDADEIADELWQGFGVDIRA